MPTQGIAPTIIQWDSESNPAKNLSSTSLTFDHMKGFHYKADEINGALGDLGFSEAFTAERIDQSETPYLRAYIKSPRGIIQLE